MADPMPVMKCGCRAMGTQWSSDPEIHGRPVCTTHAPNDDAYTPLTAEETQERLNDRQMRCSYRTRQDRRPCVNHTTPTPSNPAAAFFASKPNEEYDTYYCGCWGWD